MLDLLITAEDGMTETLQGKAPGTGAGDMSRRTARLRPAIGMSDKEIKTARQLRRTGAETGEIAQAMQLPVDRIERALLQMRSARPETTRGTLNVTLKAHRLVMAERNGDEPLWQTMDRLLGELLALRKGNSRGPSRQRTAAVAQPALNL